MHTMKSWNIVERKYNLHHNTNLNLYNDCSIIINLYIALSDFMNESTNKNPKSKKFELPKMKIEKKEKTH
jgi:hypothetical protein